MSLFLHENIKSLILIFIFSTSSLYHENEKTFIIKYQVEIILTLNVASLNCVLMLITNSIVKIA